MQAEAAIRMRGINDAFRCVVTNHVFRPTERPVSAARSSSQVGRRLTKEEIDRMVESLGNEGPLDWLLEERPDPPLDRLSVASLVAMGTGLTPFFLAGAFGFSDRAVLFWMTVACVAGFVGALRVLPKE